jgi:ethanolamine utilization protein EutP (predicted NTPase)
VLEKASLMKTTQAIQYFKMDNIEPVNSLVQEKRWNIFTDTDNKFKNALDLQIPTSAMTSYSTQFAQKMERNDGKLFCTISKLNIVWQQIMLK